MSERKYVFLHDHQKNLCSKGKPATQNITISLILHKKPTFQDLETISKFAMSHNLGIAEIRCDVVKLKGTPSDLKNAFALSGDILSYEHESEIFHGIRLNDNISVPSELKNIVLTLLGFSNHHVAIPHAHGSKIENETASPQTIYGYTPEQVALGYQFPSGTGKGQYVSIIELGGGYMESSIATYCQNIGVSLPNIIPISIDGATNNPSTPNSADGEVHLDIELVSGIVPEATILVLFAPNTYAGFYDAISHVFNDQTYKSKIISISWAGPELYWSQSAMIAMNSILQKCAESGISIFVSSGDSGSTCNIPDGLQHVLFPGTSPWSICCGGTSLQLNLQNNPPTIISETTWNSNPPTSTEAGGGGVSDYQRVPSYQTNNLIPLPVSADPNHHTGRCIPDLSGCADPAHGFYTIVDGEVFVYGGTSCVSPLMAGLTARINQNLNKTNGVGNINYVIYQAPHNQTCFRDITSGNIGAYSATPSYDLASGWGSIKGIQLQNALINW